jgi:hypothetical protein
MAIKHLAWISLPEPCSGYNGLKNNLLNLSHLTLHAIFLARQTEFIWFTKIPAKLKNLVKLRVNGLVWHAGYDRQQAWVEDPTWEDIEDNQGLSSSLDQGLYDWGNRRGGACLLVQTSRLHHKSDQDVTDGLSADRSGAQFEYGDVGEFYIINGRYCGNMIDQSWSNPEDDLRLRVRGAKLTFFCWDWWTWLPDIG